MNTGSGEGEAFIVLKRRTNVPLNSVVDGLWGFSGYEFGDTEWPTSDVGGTPGEPQAIFEYFGNDWGVDFWESDGSVSGVWFPTITFNTWRRYNVRVNSATPIVEARIDSTSLGTLTDMNDVNFNWTASEAGAHQIGGSDTGLTYFDGWIGEFFVYDRVLTSGERADVDDYLVNRWFTSHSTQTTAATGVAQKAVGETIATTAFLTAPGKLTAEATAALKRSGVAKTAAASTVVVRRTQGTATAGAILLMIQRELSQCNAVLRGRRTNATDAGAILTGARRFAVTAQAILGHYAAANANACLLGRPVVGTGADAWLTPGGVAAFALTGASAALVGTVQQTSGANAVLVAATTGVPLSVTADAHTVRLAWPLFVSCSAVLTRAATSAPGEPWTRFRARSERR